MSPLLAAYPARLRRKHGAELLQTLTEMAGPGGRPAPADKLRLVLDGLRERLRPPTRRPLAVAAAVLALFLGGALGAAAGSWLGTWSYATLPDAASLGQRALPRVGSASTSDTYLFAEGPLDAGADVRPIVELSRQKLAAEGWLLGPLKTGAADLHYAAEKAGVRLDVYAYPELHRVDIAGWPLRPGSYLPWTIAGTLLGLLAGWSVGVALAHRVRAARRPGRSVVLSTLGLMLVIPSAVGFVASLSRYLTVADPLGFGELVHGHGFAFGPTIDLLRAYDLGEGWLLTPGDFQQLPLYGFALIAAAAILARPSREHEAVA